MANITVTSTTNSVIFDLGVYATAIGFSKRTRLKSSLDTITLHPDHVEYKVIDGSKYALDWQTNAQNRLIVDSINGVAPTSLSDLFDKINTVLA